MKSIKIVPKICSGDDAKWQGYVVVKALSFDDRYEMFESLNIKMSEDGSVELSKLDQIKTIREMVKLSKKLYLEVDLKSIEGEEVKSFDDMQYVEDLHAVMIEVATKMMSGFKVGNG